MPAIRSGRSVIKGRIQGGAALPGTYPPKEQMLAEYEDWNASNTLKVCR